MELFRRLKKNKKKENKNSIETSLRKRIQLQVMVMGSSVLLVVVLVFAMTAAWFTNVAKSSSLVLETESWGFDEEKILLADDTEIKVTPGASGIIPLAVDNSEAAQSVKITAAISKAMMDPELQKRIFFYADTSKTVSFRMGLTGIEAVEEIGSEDTTASGAASEDAAAADETSQDALAAMTETVSKIYLGAAAPDTYTYTILAGQKLTISDLYYNDIPIKWEWVYDMLGYYFRGTVDAESPVIKDEYLRPIEYDYDNAVYDTVGESATYQLLQVGETTTADFLVQLSSTDGYFGTIDVKEAVPVSTTDSETGATVTRLYYPVSVDSTGYGIWAYLCDYNEIQEGFAYDTALAASENPVQAKATLYLTAYNVPARTESITSEEAFLTALTEEDVDVIELHTDIMPESPIIYTEGTKVIDLNGHVLRYNGPESEYQLFTVSDGASLTIMNGQLDGTTAATGFSSQIATRAVQAVGGNVVLSDVKVSNFDAAVVVADYTASTAGDSVVQITNSDLTGTQTALLLQGNGSYSDALTKVIVQNSKLTSLYGNGITGQGSGDRWGTELILADSEVSGYYGGIYQPQQKSLTTITNSTITGNTGIILKGGTMKIADSTIIGTGDVAADDAKVVGSGYTDTGDGVYVEAGYAWAATLTLEGENTTVTSNKAYAVELIGEEQKGPGRILIYDGTYTGANTETRGDANWNGIGTFEIYGGTFTNDKVNVTITRYDTQTEQTE